MWRRMFEWRSPLNTLVFKVLLGKGAEMLRDTLVGPRCSPRYHCVYAVSVYEPNCLQKRAYSANPPKINESLSDFATNYCHYIDLGKENAANKRQRECFNKQLHQHLLWMPGWKRAFKKSINCFRTLENSIRFSTKDSTSVSFRQASLAVL